MDVNETKIISVQKPIASERMNESVTINKTIIHESKTPVVSKNQTTIKTTTTTTTTTRTSSNVSAMVN